MKHVWLFSGKKAESDNFDIDDEVLSYIANNIKSNVRELEGALNKLLAYNNLVHIPITMDIAEKELPTLSRRTSHGKSHHSSLLKLFLNIITSL